MKGTISTFQRYLYLNTYAFLLILIGIGTSAFPLWSYSILYTIAQGIISIICIKGGISIFKSWDDKKRKYQILMTRNYDAFREDTFSEYMKAPCGRLLVKIVLKDLGINHQYSGLLKYKTSFIAYIRDNRKTQKVKIVFHNQ